MPDAFHDGNIIVSLSKVTDDVNNVLAGGKGEVMLFFFYLIITRHCRSLLMFANGLDVARTCIQLRSQDIFNYRAK